MFWLSEEGILKAANNLLGDLFIERKLPAKQAAVCPHTARHFSALFPSAVINYLHTF